MEIPSKFWIPNVSIKNYVLLVVLLLSAHDSIAQQNDPLNQSIVLYKETVTFDEVSALLAEDYNLILSYNSSMVDSDVEVYIKDPLTLQKLLKKFIKVDNFSLYVRGNRIIITPTKSYAEIERLHGYIYDIETQEALIGVIITDTISGQSSFSNEVGYYSLPIDSKRHHIVFSYIGYDQIHLRRIDEFNQNLYMTSKNKFDPIIILDKIADAYDYNTGAYFLDISQESLDRNLSYTDDINKMILSHPQVQSGNEAQMGYVVHGASPDQNLTLIDGVTVFEPGHTLGLNSIFMHESVSSARLLTQGIPARYGDRSASVLDIKLKDGNKEFYEGGISLKLSEVRLQIEGPIIKNKTSFNVAYRQSIYNQYLPKLIDKYSNYDDVSIKYHDFLIKVAHKFNTRSNLKAFYYSGHDDFFIGKQQTERLGIEKFTQNNRNNITWGNQIGGIEYNSTIGNKIHATIKAAISSFSHASLGSFYFNHSVDSIILSTNSFNLQSDSNIDRSNIAISLDYYINGQNKLHLGMSWSGTESTPSIAQYVDSLPQFFEDRITFNTSKFNAYIEDVIRPTPSLLFYVGLRYTAFNNNKVSHYLQPRLKISFTPYDYYQLSASYDNMVQTDHQLVNSGLGLPSDLWVTSIGDIKPERSHKFTFNQDLRWRKSWRLTSNVYYRRIYNILDYESIGNIFFIDLNNVNKPILNEIDSWQMNVIRGKGFSYGAGAQLRYETERFNGWVTYHYGRQKRRFSEIDNGKTFYSRLDRPHDTNIGLSIRLDSHISLGTQFTHVSGNRFSLSLDGYDSVSGIKLVSGLDRNNYRYPYYQKIDIFGSYKRELDHSHLKIQFGVSNALNRLNAYYVYIYTNPLTDKMELRKLSLFPVIPHIDFSLYF